MGRRRSTYYLQSDPFITYCNCIDRGRLNSHRKSFSGSYGPRSEDRGVRKANMILNMHKCLPGHGTGRSCCWRACIIMFLCIIRSPSVCIFTSREDLSGRNNKNTGGGSENVKNRTCIHINFTNKCCVCRRVCI